MVVAIVAPLVAAATVVRHRSIKKSLENTVDDSKQSIQAAERARIDAESELGLLCADHADVLERLAAAERARDDAERKVAQVERDAKAEASKAKTERETAVKLRFSLTVANGRVEKMRKEIGELNVRLASEGKMEEEISELRAKMTSAERNLADARLNVKKLTEKNGALVAEVSRLENALEDARAAETKLETARAKNAMLTNEKESMEAKLAAATHALQDAEDAVRAAESQNVRTALDADELREQLVQLRAHELELQVELKEMLETVQSLTTHEEGAGGGGFASPIEIERVLAKIASSPIGGHHGDYESEDMLEVQSRMAVLMSRVEECKTPTGIANALKELGELEGKLREIQPEDESNATASSPSPRDVSSPDAWPISPPSPVTVQRGAFDEQNDDDGPNVATPPRNLNFDAAAMCEKCGQVERAEGLARCAACHAKKQEKLANSPLQRAKESFKERFASPSKVSAQATDDESAKLSPLQPKLSPLQRAKESFKERMKSPTGKKSKKNKGGKK